MKGTRDDKPGTLREEHLEALFRQTAKRQEPPDDVREQVRAAVHAEWTKHHGRRQRSWYVPLAAAASLILAAVIFALTLLPPSRGPATDRFATVERLEGDIQSLSASGQAIDLTLGTSLGLGQELRGSAQSGAALLWQGSVSVRLDQHTRVRLAGPSRLELMQGRVYVDTRSDSGAELTIETPAGSLRHIGTQYMTAVAAGDTTISVRSGKVQADLSGGRVVSQGEQVLFGKQGIKAFRRIDIHGEDWLWAESLAPAWQAEDRTVAEFLDWVAQETGRTIEYQTPEARQLAADSRLKGEIRTDPVGALELVLPATGLEAITGEGLIRVRIKADGD